jgi:predicted acylesterase/phospholipase RssA
MVAGTSTGGIMAVGLTKPNDARTDAALSAADLVKLYQDNGGTIFNRTVWHALEAIGQLNGPKYDGIGERDTLTRYLAGARLSETRTAVLVTAYDIEKRLPYFFKSWKARADAQSDFPLIDVARATSAAPTFFPPVQVTASGGGAPRAFVDGGVFANNPTMCALADAWKMWPGDDLLVVSLGTGNTDRPILYDRAKAWGLAQWALPLAEILIDGVTDTVDYQAATVLDDGRYFRFQTDLPHSLQEFDDPGNVPALVAHADRMIAASADRISAVCDQLVRAKTPGAAAPSSSLHSVA